MPLDVFYYILNSLSWDWFGVDDETRENIVEDKNKDLSESSGIGWRTGNYRRLIVEHQQLSSQLQRLDGYYDDEDDDEDFDSGEEDEDEDEDDHAEFADGSNGSDDDDGDDSNNNTNSI